MERKQFRQYNYQSMICKSDRIRIWPKIQSVLPDSDVDSNSDKSWSSKSDEDDPIQDFTLFSNKLTHEDDFDWTNKDLLLQLLKKQYEIQKCLPLATYFGGTKPSKLHEINKDK